MASINVKIFSMGHGCSVYLEYDNGLSILYDCGSNAKVSEKAKEYIHQHVKPSIIIVSHFHRDHYNLILNTIPKETQSKVQRFIYPYVMSKAMNFEQFKEAFNDRLCEIKDNNNIDLLKRLGFDNTSLYMSINATSPTKEEQPENYTIHYNEVDNSGLILTIGNEKSTKLILAGDASYISWHPDVIKHLYDSENVLIPHHGRNIIVIKDSSKSNLDQTFFVSSDSTPFEDWPPIQDVSFTKHRTFINNLYEDTEYSPAFEYTADEKDKKGFVEFSIKIND